MSQLYKKSKTVSFTANILVKKEDGMFVAHCLELDIVAVAPTVDEVRREIVSLICAHIDYAFVNDNIENLYHPTPPALWQEFYKCREQEERVYDIKASFKKDDPSKVIPPWLVTKTCSVDNNICYA